MRTGGIDGSLTETAVACASNGCIGNRYSIPCTVLDGSNHPACETTTIVPYDLEGNDSGIPADTRDTNCVIPLRCNNARHMGAMAMAIRRVVIAIRA